MTPMLHHRINGGVLSSIREIVFGLEDSLVSTLGVVVGVAAGTEDARIVILTGLVLIVVEALSMGAGSFLSSKSHRQVLEQAIREERHEIETEPEKEIEELRAMYKMRGFTDDEIEILVRRIAGNKELMLEEMMAKELKIGEAQLEEPAKNAGVMLSSYFVGGIVPVAPFFLLPVGAASLVAVTLTVVALFALGFWKAKVAAVDTLKSGAEMVIIAGAAAAFGFGVGRIVGMVTGIQAG